MRQQSVCPRVSVLHKEIVQLAVLEEADSKRTYAASSTATLPLQ